MLNIYFGNGSFKEASYSGGGNITFKGTLDGDAYFKARLFQGELILGDLPVHFTYSVSYLICMQVSYKAFELFIRCNLICQA